MSNSPLVKYTKISPNSSNPRNHAIDTITIHCMAGNCTIETCGEVFAPPSRQASSNYGIGTDGRIGMYVEEKNRSWCTSSGANDNRAITIEVANTSASDPWPVSDKALAALIDLCADICKRNNIKKLLWKGEKKLIGNIAQQNMTVHRWFAAKACPGDYLYERHSYIANEVNKLLGASTATPMPPPTSTDFKVGDIVQFTSGGVYSSASASVPVHSRGKSRCKVTKVVKSKHPYHLVSEDGMGVHGWVDSMDVKSIASASQPDKFAPYSVRVTGNPLTIRKGAGTNFAACGAIRDNGVYTIVEESDGTGAKKWGKLKSGAGWISLDYTTKI